MLEENIVDLYLESLNAPGVYERQIAKRVDYLLRELYPKMFNGFEIDWYGWHGVTEDFEGSLASSINVSGGLIELGDHSLMRTNAGKQRNSSMWEEYFPEIPIEFLTMSDEDIVKLVCDNITKKEKALEEKRLAALKKNEEKEAAKKALLSKLTAEEKELLRFK